MPKPFSVSFAEVGVAFGALKGHSITYVQLLGAYGAFEFVPALMTHGVCSSGS